jgi:hypothetical protein
MNAPYLILNGKPAEIGQKYWTVIISDYSIRKEIAANENNTVDRCYFDNEADASKYQQMGTLLKLLKQQVDQIEILHRYDGFRFENRY